VSWDLDPDPLAHQSSLTLEANDQFSLLRLAFGLIQYRTACPTELRETDRERGEVCVRERGMASWVPFPLSQMPPLHEIIVIEDLSDTKILKGSVEGWRDLPVMIISKPSHRLWCISCGGMVQDVVEQLEVIRLLLGNSRVIKISESQGR
jgi:hypothetical protein